MKHRNIVGFVWFWALWATGSTLDYFGAMPTWPLFAAGLAVGVYIVLPRAIWSRRGKQPSTPEHLRAA